MNAQLKRMKSRIERDGRNHLVSLRLVGISKASQASRIVGALPFWQQRLFVRAMFATTFFANRILPGYVSPNDAGKYELVVDRDGPASYLNVSTANSGDQVNAIDLGLSGFESVGVDSMVNTVPTGAAGNSLQSVVEVSLGSNNTTNTGLSLGATAVASAVLHWFQAATRAAEFANAANLSAAQVRLRIMAV